MKIFQSEHDRVIGEFLYQTVEFTQKEFADKGIGVISQSAVRQYLIEERPDLKIKKLGSFKFDSQENTVTVRIATINKIVPVALLNPGYDELAAQVEGLKEQLELGAEVYDELKEKHDLLSTTYKKLLKYVAELETQYVELQHKKNIVGRLYDALVIAVSKDAQKFSDLLVENEELKVSLMRYMKTDMYAEIDENNL